MSNVTKIQKVQDPEVKRLVYPRGQKFWTPEEIAFIMETLDWDAEEVAKTLGRTEKAILVRRGLLDKPTNRLLVSADPVEFTEEGMMQKIKLLLAKKRPKTASFSRRIKFLFTGK